VLGEDGFGKRTLVSSYRRAKGRGGQGVRTTTSPPLAAALVVREHNELVVATRAGKIVRLAVRDFPIREAAARGSQMVRLKGTDRVATATQTALEMP
jgi:DNA gyrase/topoisomerase IV subunit A